MNADRENGRPAVVDSSGNVFDDLNLPCFQKDSRLKLRERLATLSRNSGSRRRKQHLSLVRTKSRRIYCV